MKRENATAAAQDLHADDEKTHFFLIVFPLGNNDPLARFVVSYGESSIIPFQKICI